MEPPAISNETKQEIEVKGGSKNSIGVMLLIKAEEMHSDPQEMKLCKWATMFHSKMKDFISENFKFFELRPFDYARPTE